MMELKARTALSLYRIAGSCMRPFVPLYLSMRAARGKEDGRRKKERLGRTDKARPEGPLIWLHAASVGETLALVPLIDRILSLNIHVLLTTGTVTSASLVENRFGSRLIHQYAPLDLKSAVRRFLEHWKPDLALVCESEIWPLRINGLAKRHIPQVMVNAHMSERSFHSWKKRPALAAHIFRQIDAAIGQTDADAEQYHALGVKTVAVSGNLKADVAPLENKALLQQYQAAISKRPVWAAISTHEGEELIAAEVHAALKSRLPDLLTIIVPRHPERSAAVVEMLNGKNLNIVQRSHDGVPGPQTDILLGDTIGEMGLFLRLARVAFIGKSLGDQGGHNPLEPALLGSAILTGPHVENFQDTFDAFFAQRAARIVEDATQLAVQVNTLLTHEKLRQDMADAAYRTATDMSGALERTLKVLRPFIQPLIMQAKLNQRDGENGW